jgi:1,2-diacylglycerol 3-beta-galactosyltransferase
MDPINFATVVTDFTTCSNLWFHRGVSKCFVPTEYAAERAKCVPARSAIVPWGLTDAGVPVRPHLKTPA